MVSIVDLAVVGTVEPTESLPDMASADERFKEAFRRIQALESKPSGSRSVTSPSAESWPKRNAYWFFPVTTIGVALLVGSGFLAFVAGSFVDNRTEAKLVGPLKTLRKVEDGILRIEIKVDTFVNALLAERLRAATRDFRNKLGDVNAILELANKTNTKIQDTLAEEIKTQLQRVPPAATLNYWQTVGTLVTQRTVIAKGMTLEQALRAPSCPSLQKLSGSHRTFHGLQETCKPGEALDIDGWTFTDSKFIGLLIRYRGTAPAVFINTTFLDCSFLLVLPAQPQPELQLLASSILNNPNLVEFKGNP